MPRRSVARGVVITNDIDLLNLLRTDKSDTSENQRPIARVGFFHFGCPDDQKNDPLGSLELEIAKQPDLSDSLIVLPEAFNARGGYYCPEPTLDGLACGRLRDLSVRYDVSFVVGLIAGVKGHNGAYLISGVDRPKRLSCKRCRGWDRLYTPCPTDEDTALICRGIAIAALVCDDAGRNEYRAPVLGRLTALSAIHHVMCIPAYMTSTTGSLETARLWANESLTVALSNGCLSRPSVILQDGRETVSHNLHQNQIMLCRLDPSGIA